MQETYTSEEIKSACIRRHFERLGVEVPRRWQGIGPVVYEQWKTLIENPRYEMNDQGKVRVRVGQRNAGHVLRQFRKNGSMCVEVWRGTKHTTLRLWMLMEKYWPRIRYPRDWKPKDRAKQKPDKSDGRVKLTEEQVHEIMESKLTPSQIARTGKYPVGRRHISRIKNGA